MSAVSPKIARYLVSLGAVVLSGVVLLWTAHVAASQEKENLARELAKARKEGLPTTWQEFAATIKPAKPSENAASLYLRLNQGPLVHGDPIRLAGALALRPSPSRLAAAIRELSLQKHNLALLDQATVLPRCWFDRDWSDGPPIPMLEYAYMLFGSKTLTLRGTVAAHQGDSLRAIQDVDRVFTISRHASEEGAGLALRISDSIYAIGVHALALWNDAYPHVGAYHKALLLAIHKWPGRDLQHVCLQDLLEMRDVLRRSLTPEGRARLGLGPGDTPVLEKDGDRFLALLFSRAEADTGIVRDERRLWEAYRLPPKQRLEGRRAIWQELDRWLVAYPLGKKLYLSVAGDHPIDGNDALYDCVQESLRLRYAALARVLETRPFPNAFDLKDYHSPFDGKPLSYTYDGRQIHIDVSHPDEVDLPPLNFPTEPELGIERRL